MGSIALPAGPSAVRVICRPVLQRTGCTDVRKPLLQRLIDVKLMADFRRRAFSLLELLVVVGCLTALAVGDTGYSRPVDAARTPTAEDTLRIDRAYIGTTDAWRDVTAFLRQHLSGDALSVTIAQPFTEIGGDPASGKGKYLIVDYRLNGRAFRLWLEEQYPVAFTIQLPSPDAKAPGADSRARAMLKNAVATLHLVAEGDPLPDLAPLGLGSDVAPTHTPILLCLFDSQQRPSRHLLRQVTEEHEALRQKGLRVLGVQAAVIDSRSFQQWKGSNAFPFPMGQAAQECAQTAWVTGIASLPWLVLTDAKHRIAAEGFALEEIDAKLKSMEK